MRVLDSGQRYAADDLIRCRINDGEQVQAMYGDQDVPREGIVDGVFLRRPPRGILVMRLIAFPRR